MHKQFFANSSDVMMSPTSNQIVERQCLFRVICSCVTSCDSVLKRECKLHYIPMVCYRAYSEMLEEYRSFAKKWRAKNRFNFIIT